MSQDFSKKLTIVVREDVVSWQLTNTIGHIAAYLGNKMAEPFDTGEFFVSKDGVRFPRNSQFPIVVLRATAAEVGDVLSKLHTSNLLWIAYVQEMIDMIDNEELAKAFVSVAADDMNVLGVGVFGPKEELKALTGGLKLWK